MIEVLSNTSQIAAATVAGYAAGQALEHRARHLIAEKRGVLLGAHQGAGKESLAKQSWLRRATAGLAIMGATTGFLAGHITFDNNEGDPSAVGVAVDNSYGTSTKRTVPIAEAFAEADGLKPQAVVAHNGDYGPIKLGDLSKDRPYGPSSIDVAATVSMNTVFNTEGTSDDGAQVVVITDGNSIGKVDTIVAKAKGPVNIANVGSQKGPVTKDLKEIANKTKGEYWGPESDPKDIVNKVEKQADERNAAPAESPSNNSDWAIAALMLLGATGLRYRDRKDETAVS